VTTVVVEPAGAGHETLWLLLAAGLILATAALVVGWHGRDHHVAELAPHQLDARRDLTAAEQGLYADLRVAYDELLFYAEAPAVAELADSGLPPFIADASAARRGDHRWQRLTLAGATDDGPAAAAVVYYGETAEPEVAGSLLLAAPAADTEPSDVRVWLNREAGATLPASLVPADLAKSGWHLVVAQFDAGVTRERQ